MVAWVTDEAALSIHVTQLAAHGGAVGVRDAGAFESAMARPRNLSAYGEPDMFALAAAYAFGLARNHAFVDGNKRTSQVVTETFLRLNGVSLDADDDEVVRVWLAIADGSLAEEDIAGWLRRNCSRRST